MPILCRGLPAHPPRRRLRSILPTSHLPADELVRQPVTHPLSPRPRERFDFSLNAGSLRSVSRRDVVRSTIYSGSPGLPGVATKPVSKGRHHSWRSRVSEAEALADRGCLKPPQQISASRFPFLADRGCLKPSQRLPASPCPFPIWVPGRGQKNVPRNAQLLANQEISRYEVALGDPATYNCRSRSPAAKVHRRESEGWSACHDSSSRY